MMPFIVQSIKEKRFDDRGLSLVSKQTLSDNEFLLSANRYEISVETSEYQYKSLLEVSDFFRGITFSKKDETEDISKSIKVLRANNISLGGFLNFDEVKHISNKLDFDNSKKLKKNDIFICTASGSKSHIGKVAFIKDDLDYYFGGFMGALRAKETILPEYLFLNLNSKKFNDYLVKTILGANINNINNKILKDFNPLPPLEVQQEIVDELEEYQKIIDGCKQVVENCKPTIEIDPSWEMVELGKLPIDNLDKKRKPITKKDRIPGEIPYYGATGIVDYVKDYLFDERLLLVGEDGAKWDRGENTAFIVEGKSWVNNHAHVLKVDNSKVSDTYIEIMLNSKDLNQYITGAVVPKLNQSSLNSIKLPIPSLDIQKEIVQKIEEERKVIEGNKKLIEIYTQKIQDRINKVWGE